MAAGRGRRFLKFLVWLPKREREAFTLLWETVNAMSVRLAKTLAMRELAGKGRGLVALDRIAHGSTVLECTPMAHVLKSHGSAPTTCAECLAPMHSSVNASLSRDRTCTSACEAAYEERGGTMLDRVDVSGLKLLQEEQGRNFPLLIASLLSSLLADLKAGQVPESWGPLELCFAEMHAEALPQIEAEHRTLLQSFTDAGLATLPTLELLMPIARYRRLLGAAQLNAFELTLSHGAKVSALLPQPASLFNHSCEPNVLISCGDTSSVSFVAEGSLAAGDELCISYIDVDVDRKERQELLLHKYGFECTCPRCTRGA